MSSINRDAASSGKLPLTSWPVIVNNSLETSEIRRLLGKKHKVRVTETTGKDVVIFPLSSVAFMLLRLDQTTKNDMQERMMLDPKVVERVERLQQIHRHCYIIVMAALMSEQELQTLVALQRRFLDKQLGFIPAHNPKECVDCMLNIAKVTCRPLAQVIKERLQKLQSSTISDSVILHIMSNLGLNSHECFVLQDGCQSLARIATANKEELMDCSLDQTAAQKIIKFFEKDCIPI